MDQPYEPGPGRLLTLPDAARSVLSIRAKALLFHDARSVDLIERVERIARSDATVLLIGETGTGKELIARHVHASSGRRGPFLAVNCGAFSENLIDAELFGHESGAYTGAQGSRAGWFEAAQGGTLFLDEIGDLPLALQVKLLRVLQERSVVRLGSRKSVAVDVRLVAATNIDLRRAVAAQHFRADLYYRLSVATVELPPLRERPGDILPLARHFIGMHGPRVRQQDAVLSPKAEAALQAYPWPGNIRELENVIHFALIVCRNGEIRASDLKLVCGVQASEPAVPAGDAGPVQGERLHGFVLPADAPGAAIAAEGPTGLPAVAPALDARGPLDRLTDALRQLLSDGAPELHHRVEALMVRLAFEVSRENQVRTARLLGVTRNTVRTLLKRHGLLAGGPTDDSATDFDDDGSTDETATLELSDVGCVL